MVRYRAVAEESKKKLGQMIAQARRDRGLTQLELSEQLGVTPDGVKSWEYGRSAPTVRAIKSAIKKVLGLDVDDLLRTGKLEYLEHAESRNGKKKSKKK